MVQVQLRAEQPMVLSGNADDSEMRRVLTYVVENGERFDAGVRLDCLDALKAQAQDLQVRRALLTAARKDQNPAVRMKALEALRDSSSDDEVRGALLEALTHDANPGVRVEVVNMLVHSLARDMQNGSISTLEVPDDAVAVPQGESGEGTLVADESAERVIRTLERLEKRDPSQYVRLRSAAALRQIGPREVQ
jgi:hypothetical protein